MEIKCHFCQKPLKKICYLHNVQFWETKRKIRVIFWETIIKLICNHFLKRNSSIYFIWDWGKIIRLKLVIWNFFSRVRIKVVLYRWMTRKNLVFTLWTHVRWKPIFYSKKFVIFVFLSTSLHPQDTAKQITWNHFTSVIFHV